MLGPFKPNVTAVACSILVILDMVQGVPSSPPFPHRGRLQRANVKTALSALYHITATEKRFQFLFCFYRDVSFTLCVQCIRSQCSEPRATRSRAFF